VGVGALTGVSLLSGGSGRLDTASIRRLQSNVVASTETASDGLAAFGELMWLFWPMTAGSTGIMRGSYGGVAFFSPAGGACDIAAC
jgi:hypothetical protein